MLPLAAGREASSGAGAPEYERHRPERTLLYQLIEQYYPALKVHLAAQDPPLPGYKAGFSRKVAHTGAVTLMTCMDALMPRAQGCAGAPHLLFLDGGVRRAP
jgi:hypothetical protein